MSIIWCSICFIFSHCELKQISAPYILPQPFVQMGLLKHTGAGFSSTRTDGWKTRTILCHLPPSSGWLENVLCCICTPLHVQAALGRLKDSLSFMFLGQELYFVTQRGTADFQLLFEKMVCFRASCTKANPMNSVMAVIQTL